LWLRKGAKRGFDQVIEHVSSADSALPEIIRTVLQRMVEEIRSMKDRLRQIDAELATIAGRADVCERLQKIPGVGVIAATAFAGSVGDISSFRNARRFASWLGLTPREFSSEEVRRLEVSARAAIGICGCF
jgi:transposase